MNISEITAEACASVFCDTPAVWMNGTTQVDLLLAIEIQPGLNKNGQVVLASDEEMIAGCLMSSIAGIKNKQVISINGTDYRVLSAKPDSGGWATIKLEKA